MEINKIQDGDSLTIALTGRLDTTTAPRLEAELKSSISGVAELIFDFEKLDACWIGHAGGIPKNQHHNCRTFRFIFVQYIP